METMTVGAFKTRFSDVVSGVKKGKKYAVSYGKSKKKVAVIIPYDEYAPKKRQLGLLADKGGVVFSKDFKMSDDEFLIS